MGDLIVGFAVIGAAAFGLFLLTARAAVQHNARAIDAAAVLVVAGLLAYIRWIWYDPRLAEWLPFANLIVIGNWLPLFAAALAGLVWERLSAVTLRKWLTVGALAASGVLAAIFPLLGETPQCGQRWDGLGTCLQTTSRTCSPACAATLLVKHGIPATEQEMARLCLTRTGTSWQGLYRGLKLKTAGTEWDVQVCRGPIEDLIQQMGGPLIVSVGLPSGEAPNSEFTREFGWVPGVNHSVILESIRPGGTVVIADPTQEMAREQWDRDMLRLLWQGHAMRLVPRER
jgi:hypothetical protein